MTTEDIFDSLPAPMMYSDEEASRLILQGIGDSFLLLNTQLCVVYFNNAAQKGIRRFLGWEISPGQSIMDFVEESRRPYLAKLYEEVLQGNHRKTELYFTLDNGSVLYFENSFFPARDARGIITGIIVASKDITAKKKTQQAIQESEERLQLALDATSQGVWDWNLLTNEVTYSASYKKMYGFAENELRNHVSEWMTRIHPEDQEKMSRSVDEHLLADNPVYDSQYRIRAKDGQYRWVLAKGRLVYNEAGKPVRMIGTHADITEAVEREEKLRQINERYNSMMRATNELLWEWDIVNDYTYRSDDGLRKVYGTTDNSAIETHEGWLQRVHPDDRRNADLFLKKIIQGSHQQNFEFEYRFLRDDGHYAYIYDRGILLKDDAGKPLRMIGASQDISERKRLEKELLKHELEHQRQIHQATVDSQEKERAEIGKELHDNVNQVLTTTKLYLDLALATTELKEDLIAKSVRNINNVIQEIRQLSRSLMDPTLGDLGLLDSLNDLIDNIHLTQKLTINLKTQEGIEESLDSTQKLALFRILQESLNNVLRHAKATEVQVEMTLHSGHLLLVITDNGIGFTPGKVKLGAGLKNIQNRIYLINGTLQVKSLPGKGCKLMIQFPIQ